MTGLQCLRGPMDGAVIEADIVVGQRITLPVAPRKASYPNWCTFMVWDLVQDKSARCHAVYERDFNNRLVYIETMEVQT